MSMPSEGKRSRSAPREEPPISTIGLAHLSVVYVVWGSTYLAIRVAVREGAGFPPFWMAGSRVLVGGLLLFVWAMLRRRPLQLSRRDFGVLAGSGTLLWLGGNGLVSWAEQRADSGLAALVIASTPIWVALIEAVLDRRAPSLLLVGSLLLGFAGIGLLSAPQILDGTQADLWAVVGLLGAALSWGSGTLLQQRLPVSVPPRVSSAYQHLFGGVGLALVALLVRDPVPRPSPDAWLAWGYLVIFGSVIAFTSYIQALRLLPTTVVVTYAYVNPVIAVVLGWAVLGERLTFWTALGAPLVLLGVAGVFRDRMRQRARIRAQMARVEAG